MKSLYFAVFLALSPISLPSFAASSTLVCDSVGINMGVGYDGMDCHLEGRDPKIETHFINFANVGLDASLHLDGKVFVHCNSANPIGDYNAGKVDLGPIVFGLACGTTSCSREQTTCTIAGLKLGLGLGVSGNWEASMQIRPAVDLRGKDPELFQELVNDGTMQALGWM
jgi:hypothetical protein